MSVCFPVAQEQVTVGVKEAPPFTFKNADGEWSGITIDIWNEINPEFDNATLSEKTLEDLIKSVERGGISTGLGAISITWHLSSIVLLTPLSKKTGSVSGPSYSSSIFSSVLS